MRSARKKATRKTTVRRKPGVRKGAKAWTAAETTMLKREYKTHSATEIAKMLRRSVSSVKAKARTLGLKKPVRRKAAPKKRTTPKKAAARKTVAKRKTTRKTTAKRKTTRKR